MEMFGAVWQREEAAFKRSGRVVPVDMYDLNINDVYTTLILQKGLEHGRFEWQEPTRMAMGGSCGPRARSTGNQ